MPVVVLSAALVLLALFWTFQFVHTVPALLRTPWLPAAGEPATAASVTVIVAAKDEQDAIVDTLRLLGAQTHPDLEIIAVDDRSTDDTRARMQQAAAEIPQLRVLVIEDLPHGWLGKNHAIARAATLARGEWLLLTDADVRFAPDAVSRAVQFASEHGIDHLVVAPKLRAPTFWLKSLIAFFILNFTLGFRPQYAANPRSKAFIGLGACNLVRRSVYEAVGTHAAIAMRPDEDLRLGERIKRAGFVQRFLPAKNFAEVQWYSSAADMIRGLEKNSLAIFRYSPLLLACSLIPYVYVYLAPFAALLFGRGELLIVALWTLLAMAVTYATTQRFTGYPAWLFVTTPISACVFAYALLRAAWLTTVRHGVYWRGTFYDIRQLAPSDGGHHRAARDGDERPGDK